MYPLVCMPSCALCIVICTHYDLVATLLLQVAENLLHEKFINTYLTLLIAHSKVQCVYESNNFLKNKSSDISTNVDDNFDKYRKPRVIMHVST